MLSVSITILTVLLVVVSLLMILLVLMQRPKQEGLGAAFGGGMMNDIAGAHTTDILQKGTVWLSVMFFSISILLGILYTKQIADRNNVKVLDGVKAEQLPPMTPPSISDFPQPPVTTTPETPETPPAGGTPVDSTPNPATATEGEGDASGTETPKPAEGTTPKNPEGEEKAPENAESEPETAEEKPEPPKTETETKPESGESAEGEKKPGESGNPE